MKIKARDVDLELRLIASNINDFLRQTSNDELADNIEFEDSADGRMYRNQIYNVLEQLENMKHTLDYLRRSISSEGYLQKNSSGRYELNGHDFTCGHGIEILVTDEEDQLVWYATRIEHDGDDYYAVGYKDLNLGGVKARIRER